VHTAAASQLGQMLVPLCKLEGLQLINVVRRQEQVELLQALGAEHVLNLTDPDFRQAFGALAKELGGTLAFDAVGAATTKALVLGMPPKSRVCVYGALGGGGVDVGLAGQLLGMVPGTSVEGFNYGSWMADIGPARRHAEQAKAAALLGGVLRTSFGRECRLEDLVEAESLAYYSALGTNAKVVVRPQLR
jgi:NADPH:quinone reductase-like Zn-dependent oxidoreductase